MVYPCSRTSSSSTTPFPFLAEVLMVLPEASETIRGPLSISVSSYPLPLRKDPPEDLDQFGLIGRKHWHRVSCSPSEMSTRSISPLKYKRALSLAQGLLVLSIYKRALSLAKGFSVLSIYKRALSLAQGLLVLSIYKRALSLAQELSVPSIYKRALSLAQGLSVPSIYKRALSLAQGPFYLGGADGASNIKDLSRGRYRDAWVSGVCFLWQPPLPRSDVYRAIIGSPVATARSLVVLFLSKRFFHLGSSFVGLRASPAFLRLAT
ncbi:hypothetical protein B296_00056906 [Ensete ventricosum]|uniref:Uncharacterized protein n=1 Tax=Ensete ventricosum TaxID=4639 RepID=A0A426XQG9_ENSVE|nr:hypothetical protein B296_00056906 [Ensete ventricosum]